MNDKEIVIETKKYSDGISATGVAPLPDLSPEQQAALYCPICGVAWTSKECSEETCAAAQSNGCFEP